MTESPSVSAADDNPSLEDGWVMEKSKKSVQFSERVRFNFQKALFQREETGVTANPAYKYFTEAKNFFRQKHSTMIGFYCDQMLIDM